MSNRIIHSPVESSIPSFCLPADGCRYCSVTGSMPSGNTNAANRLCFVVKFAFLQSGTNEWRTFPQMQFGNCLCGLLLLWPDDIRAQPVRIVIHAVGKDRIEDTDQLAAYRYHGLLALERILLPGRVVVVHLLKLRIAPYQWQDRLEQDIPQIPPSAFADGGLSLMLARAVFLEFQSGQLLDLLRRVKTFDIACLRKESCHRDESHSLDGEQFFNVRHLPRFRFQHLRDLPG